MYYMCLSNRISENLSHRHTCEIVYTHYGTVYNSKKLEIFVEVFDTNIQTME